MSKDFIFVLFCFVFARQSDYNYICNGIDISIYLIVSGEIMVYLAKIKVILITCELISYHFTSD